MAMPRPRGDAWTPWQCRRAPLAPGASRSRVAGPVEVRSRREDEVEESRGNNAASLQGHRLRGDDEQPLSSV